MTTQIFKNYDDFLNRNDKSINGVSEAFVKQHPDFEQQNMSNKACWNCVECAKCVGCVECNGCYSCDWCGSCIRCNGCDDCVECVECNGCNDLYNKSHITSNIIN